MSTCTHYLKSCSEYILQPLKACCRVGESLFRRDQNLHEQVSNTKLFIWLLLQADSTSKVKERVILVSRYYSHCKPATLSSPPCGHMGKELKRTSRAEEVAFRATMLLLLTPAVPRGCRTTHAFEGQWQRREAV